MWLTVLVALIVAVTVNRWLGPPYGWLVAIPAGIAGTLAVRTHGWSLIGGAVGFPVSCLIGYWFILGDALPYLKLIRALVVIGSYGAATGGSIHAIVLKHRIVGGVCLVATSIVFVMILVFPPRVREAGLTPSRSTANTATQQGSAMPGDSPEIVVGELYASKNDDGTYSIVKVLFVDDLAVHLRRYANRFDRPPSDVDSSFLTLDSIGEGGGGGVDHFPLAKELFFNDDPQFIKQVPVADDELEGYRLYLEAIGGTE
jgi:hypothetical protein